jgi:spore germination cell wall hydrolase CwlJ-like protein
MEDFFVKNIIVILLMIPNIVNAGTVIDVAWTIWAEARGETTAGRRAVATVIYNRSKQSNKTLQQVVRAPKQFSPWNAPCAKAKVYNTPVFKECLRLSMNLHNGRFKPDGTWTHFFNPDLCHPYWFKDMTDVVIIGHHVFGTIK